MMRLVEGTRIQLMVENPGWWSSSAGGVGGGLLGFCAFTDKKDLRGSRLGSGQAGAGNGGDSSCSSSDLLSL